MREGYLDEPEGSPDNSIQPKSVHFGCSWQLVKFKDGLDIVLYLRSGFGLSDSRVDRPDVSTFPLHEIPSSPQFFALTCEFPVVSLCGGARRH